MTQDEIEQLAAERGWRVMPCWREMEGDIARKFAGAEAVASAGKQQIAFVGLVVHVKIGGVGIARSVEDYLIVDIATLQGLDKTEVLMLVRSELMAYADGCIKKATEMEISAT